MAEDSHGMHKLPSKGGQGRPRMDDADPALAGETTPTPADDDSQDESWHELGSTRVVESQKPNTDERAKAPLTHERAIISTDTGAAERPTKTVREEPVRLGDFQLLRKIGEGAMGAVYRARQISFDRECALKVLFPHIADNPKLVERLYREGRVMGELDHPNLVQAFGVGEDDGWHYVAMEYVEGQSMQKWLGQLGRLSVGDAVHVILACARALAYAHKQGFVHRDVKPDNILITRDGVPKVADLGMVKTHDEDSMALTQTGHAVGTPWYMPLEQAKNAKDTDGRSDIYALGCMLYCFLTGLPPFAGKTLLEVIQAKEAGTFPPARQMNPEVPERLDLVILKMAAKRPKHRYQTCDDLINDLEGLELANASLQFLKKQSASGALAASSGDAFPVAARVDPNAWYVRTKDAHGQTVVQRLTTAQVQTMLENDLLTPNQRASHDATSGFRALATYKEFQALSVQKVSQKSQDDKSVRYRTLYKKLEQQAEEREAKKDALTPKLQNTPPWLPLALKVGGAALALILVVLFFWWLSR